MEYQKIINLLDGTPYQLTNFRTKRWVKINDQSGGMYNVNSQIKFKTSIFRSSLCDYSDAYILVTTTITVPNTGTAANPNNRKNIIVKNCSSFTYCISEINNTQIDDAKDIDIVTAMYNLIVYSNNFWRTLEMPLINCEINLILTWSATYFIIDAPIANQARTFTITDTNLYVPVVTLSTQDNGKILQQLKSGFKRTSNWNKYAPNVTVEQRN